MAVKITATTNFVSAETVAATSLILVIIKCCIMADSIIYIKEDKRTIRQIIKEDGGLNK